MRASLRWEDVRVWRLYSATPPPTPGGENRQVFTSLFIFKVSDFWISHRHFCEIRHSLEGSSRKSCCLGLSNAKVLKTIGRTSKPLRPMEYYLWLLLSSCACPHIGS